MKFWHALLRLSLRTLFSLPAVLLVVSSFWMLVRAPRPSLAF